jgi:hypothetical protein
VVKLFKKKSGQTREFKFDTSLKLKDLPNEEYAHIAHAFQVSSLRFERMLKESLLEGYITSTTLERISRNFKFADIRKLDIPETPSLIELFGSDETPTPKRITETETEKPKILTPSVEPSQPSVTEPTAPITPSIAPKPVTPTSLPKVEPIEIPSKISFSFPETHTITKPPSTTTPSTSQASEDSIPTPATPKISFPTMSKPTAPTAKPPMDPLARVAARREEDRATGIAILRKQMLTELKKIRSVVSEQDR